MSNKGKRGVIICRSESEFEEVFLPRTHERKKREKVLSEPESFGKHLETELVRCIRKQ